MLNVCLSALAALLLAGSARAGDLTVDNLAVNVDATFYGSASVDAPNGDISMGGFTNRPIGITGGTITTSGNYRIHTFTESGIFKVSGCSVTCDVFIVAGGGAGGKGGGGGAGGAIYTNGMNIETGTYSVIVGVGGTAFMLNGSNSSLNGIIAEGGGAGGVTNVANGYNGGCGGGGGMDGEGEGGIGSQGYNGGHSWAYWGSPSAGGGGMGSPGEDPVNEYQCGNGGYGISNTIHDGTLEYYAGGGGGSSYADDRTPGVGRDGGGTGVSGSLYGSTASGGAGTANTGGGGGAGPSGGSCGIGGSGIVIVRYLVQ